MAPTTSPNLLSLALDTSTTSEPHTINKDDGNMGDHGVPDGNDRLEMKDLEDDFVSISLKKEKYPAKLHAKRVARILGEAGIEAGLIYLPGQASIPYEDSDQPELFRQLRYFLYLSGLNIPDCTITCDICTNSLRVWIPPPRSGRDVIFNGQNQTPAQILEDYDFDKASYKDDLRKYLISYFRSERRGKIYILHPTMGPPASPEFYAAKIDATLLKPAMDASRAIKSLYEIKMIRKASEVTSAAHTSVLRVIKHLKNETEVEGVFTGVCISSGAKQQAYGIIAAAGTNASTLHYIANDECLKGRELLCLDAGCEWNCYASDVTRTFPISGKFSTEGRAIYDIVAQMQDECIEMVKPGANYRDVHMHAHKVALKGLMKIGLLHNGSAEDVYASGATVAFFPHGLGHYLGLECHDVGDGGNLLFAFNELHLDWATAYSEMLTKTWTAASVLAVDHVITVEPGIYFSRYALEEVWLKNPKVAKYINTELLEKYYPVGGVRIEDDILVTEDGYENLTTAPKGDEALKIINEGSDSEGPKKKSWFF